MSYDVFTGKIESYGYKEVLGDYGFELDNGICLRNHMGSKVGRFEYIGKTVNFTLEDKNSYSIGQIINNESLFEDVNKSRDGLKTGTILRINKRGAIVDIDGCEYELLNKDAFRDGGAIFKFFAQGNKIYNLELKEIEHDGSYSIYMSSKKLSSLERKTIATVKYKYRKTDFLGAKNMYIKKGCEYEGVIEYMGPLGCIVAITNEDKVWCNTPDRLEDYFKDGNRVIVKIDKIKSKADNVKKMTGSICSKIN